MTRLAPKVSILQGPAPRSCFTKAPSDGSFLDFCPFREFNAGNLRKDVLFDPPPGP